MGSYEELCASAERRGQRVELGVSQGRSKKRYRDGSQGSWRRVERLVLRAHDGHALAEIKLKGLDDLERASKQALSIS